MIYLPRGIPVRQNVNPARINIPEAMEKLRVATFTGYLRFDAPQGSGIVIFERGKLVSALFSGSDDGPRLIAYDAISKIFEVAIVGDSTLNIFRLAPELAMALHALLHGKYLYQGQDLKQVDLRALLEKINTEQLNACLRVYAAERTVLIFYDHGNALGFFHDGTADLQMTADLSKSVARLADAKFDLLEIGNVEDLVLADLLASADLGSIWQRMRKNLMRDRNQREETAIRSREEELGQKRKQMLLSMKTVAANYIGKIGLSQVEKAFDVIGPELRKDELAKFLVTMEQLAMMVAKPKKVTPMIEEMKKQFNL